MLRRFLERSRLSARRHAAFVRCRAALCAISDRRETRVSQLLAGVPSDPGRSPGTARVQACEACPQAPHPAPLTRRLARAPLGERGGMGYMLLFL